MLAYHQNELLAPRPTKQCRTKLEFQEQVHVNFSLTHNFIMQNIKRKGGLAKVNTLCHCFAMRV